MHSPKSTNPYQPTHHIIIVVVVGGGIHLLFNTIWVGSHTTVCDECQSAFNSSTNGLKPLPQNRAFLAPETILHKTSSTHQILDVISQNVVFIEY